MKRVSDDTEDERMSDPIMISKEQNVSNTYTVYFDSAIINARDYTGLLSLLQTSSEDDIFLFRFIGCPGGRLDVALPIYNAIKNTPAETVGILESYSASAATMLFLANKQFVVMPNSSMMVHGASYGAGGHMSSVKSWTEFNDKYISKLFRDVYSGFLSEEEINKLLNENFDLDLMEEEIVSRLKAMANPEQKAKATRKPRTKQKGSQDDQPSN